MKLLSCMFDVSANGLPPIHQLASRFCMAYGRAAISGISSAISLAGLLFLLTSCQTDLGGSTASYCLGGPTLQSCDAEDELRRRAHPTQPSRWQRESGGDRFTDATFSAIHVDALEPVPNLIGKPVTPMLVVKCGASLEVYIDWYRYVSRNAGLGRIRINHGPAADVAFALSTDHRATFFRTPSPLSVVTNLLGAETLLVQVVPYGEGPLTTSFPVGNLANELQQMQGTCGLSLGRAAH